MAFTLQSVKLPVLTARLVVIVQNQQLLLLKCFQISVLQELFVKKLAQLPVFQHSVVSQLIQLLNLRPTEVMHAVRTASARQVQSKSSPILLLKSRCKIWVLPICNPQFLSPPVSSITFLLCARWVSIVLKALWELQTKLVVHLELTEPIRWEWMSLTVVCVQLVTIAELLELLILLFARLDSFVQKVQLYQPLVHLVHTTNSQEYKILVSANHAQQDITVLFLVSQQLTPRWSVMLDLFVTDVLSDLNRLTLPLVRFVPRVVFVNKVAQLNPSVLLVGLVSSKEPLIQQLA